MRLLCRASVGKPALASIGFLNANITSAFQAHGLEARIAPRPLKLPRSRGDECLGARGEGKAKLGASMGGKFRGFPAGEHQREHAG